MFWGYSRALKRSEQDENLLNACKGAWHLAVRELGIPQDDLDRIGVHVWGVRGLWGARFLERRAKFTLQPRRETKVQWRRGVGAIGVAWDKDEAKIANIENLEQLGPTEQDFCGLSREARFGLSWSQFSKSKHYRAILAIPLEAEPDRVVGCLSIDVQLDGYADKLDTLSRVEKLSTVRDVCEKALGG